MNENPAAAWCRNPDGVMLLLMLMAMTLLGLAGCVTSPLGSPLPSSDLGNQSDYILLDDLAVPPVPGVAGCGAQALACALHYVDPVRFPDAAALAAELPWHTRGATPMELLLEARRRSVSALVVRGDRWRLRHALEQSNQVVIVMFDVGPFVRSLYSDTPVAELMHWSVVSGMSRDYQFVLLAAEDERHFRLPRETFMQRWRRSDFCMVILRPGSS